MLVNTKFHGELEINEKDMINFRNGLPGFADLHRFVLLPVEGNPALSYMQSVEERQACFIVVSPFLIMEDYEIDINADIVNRLDIQKPEDVNLLAILTIPEDMRETTANLLAPVIINTANNKAIQEILNDDRYKIKYKLYRGE